MLDLPALYEAIDQIPELRPWLDNGLSVHLDDLLHDNPHGKQDEWKEAIAGLPDVRPSVVELRRRVQVGEAADCTAAQSAALEQNLRRLHPWRKGPFFLYGVHVDTEWRSDWKWERLKEQIAPLNGRRVLDVGCGNGYFMWRMLAHQPRFVLGLDPFRLYAAQFAAVKKLIRPAMERLPLHLVPVGIEHLPAETRAFDTVFSMGVLYHRRSPFDHLLTLRDTLRPGGQLVLETLVVDGPAGYSFVPPRRYARMRNVWFIPTTDTLAAWLHKCRFTEIELIDVSDTTTAEQRPTDWMRFHSLPHFLDPDDSTRTIEGHPAPKRAIFLAQAPR